MSVHLSPADHAIAARITDEIMEQIRSEPQTMEANWWAPAEKLLKDSGKVVENAVKKHSESQRKAAGRDAYKQQWDFWNHK
jgi:hypothetical protein